MVSISAALTGLECLLKLNLRDRPDKRGQHERHDDLVHLSRYWGWCGRDSALTRHDAIMAIMRNAMEGHANRPGDFNLLEKDHSELQWETLPELRLKVGQLQIKLQAERAERERERGEWRVGQESIERQTQASLEANETQFQASQQELDRLRQDRDELIRALEELQSDNDRIRKELEESDLQPTTIQSTPNRKKRRTSIGIPSGPATHRKIHRPPNAPRVEEKQKEANRLLLILAKDIQQLPFHSTNGPGRLHWAKYIALHEIASGRGIMESAQLASKLTGVGERKIRDRLFDPLSYEWDLEDEVLFASATSRRGRHAKIGWFLNNPDLMQQAADWIRVNSSAPGKPNLTAWDFHRWVNETLVPGLFVICLSTLS